MSSELWFASPAIQHKWQRRNKWIVRLSVAANLAAVTAITGATAIIGYRAHFDALPARSFNLSHSCTTTDKPVGIVLTGTLDRQREAAGIELLNRQAIRALHISGINPRIFEAGQSFNTLRNLDVQYPHSISFDAAKNTRENAREIKRWLDGLPYKPCGAFLITSRYHLRRAGVEIEAAGITIPIIPYTVNTDIMSSRTSLAAEMLRTFSAEIYHAFHPPKPKLAHPGVK